jgi:hypothetical protein
MTLELGDCLVIGVIVREYNAKLCELPHSGLRRGEFVITSCPFHYESARLFFDPFAGECHSGSSPSV